MKYEIKALQFIFTNLHGRKKDEYPSTNINVTKIKDEKISELPVRKSICRAWRKVNHIGYIAENRSERRWKKA